MWTQPWHNALAQPSTTAPPVMFEPPAALTDGRHEVWIAAGGSGEWGGCEVWASVNDQTYDRIGVIGPGAVVGALVTALPAADDPDETSEVTVNVAPSEGVLYPGAPSDADLFITLCWTDDELFAYSAATLIGPHAYRLDRHKRRGVFGTPIKEHAAGARFVRLNTAIFRQSYPVHLVGHTVYVKLPAFNQFQNMLEGLDAIKAYPLVLTGASGSLTGVQV